MSRPIGPCPDACALCGSRDPMLWCDDCRDYSRPRRRHPMTTPDLTRRQRDVLRVLRFRESLGDCWLVVAGGYGDHIVMWDCEGRP